MTFLERGNFTLIVFSSLAISALVGVSLLFSHRDNIDADIPNSVAIFFDVNFEFKNYLHQKLAETFYPLIETKMIDSFKKRADNSLD